MLVNVACFGCRLLTFFSKINFLKICYKNDIRVSNGLDPDQDRRSRVTNVTQKSHIFITVWERKCKVFVIVLSLG